MKNRFDLEDEIMSLHGFADNLSTLSESIVNEELTTDEIFNIIEGTRLMLILHSKKMQDTLCQCFGLDQYKTI